MKRLITIGLSLTLMGCVAVPEVTSSDASATINTVAITCKKPYKLTQDCNNWIGASRSIFIDGFGAKVGATSDGKTILVMDPKPFENMFSLNPFILNSPKHSRVTNNSFEAVRQNFVKKGIKINRVRPLKSFGNIDGYVMELSSDGYSELKKFTVEKS